MLCAETWRLLGGLFRPRPLCRRDAPIQLLDRELDEVAVSEIVLGLPELLFELGLRGRV